MHILATNDDGIDAPGLLALAQAARHFGSVSVLAPDRNWSASGHVKTMHRPLRVKPVQLADGSPAYACDGAPSDCVALAVMGVLSQPVDLVISGINPNANVGHDVTYSGTVTAAMEGTIWGIPSLAFSLDRNKNNRAVLHYETAAAVAGQILPLVIKNGLPDHVLLNVNIPNQPLDVLRGWRVTRLGLRIYRDELIQREDPRGKPYYWIGGDEPTGVPEEGTDIGALAGNYVSISPVQLDLTAHAFLDGLRSWLNLPLPK
ncbi:MAG: 5'/3'-nucleotidase SurE [Chloroflexota bacterium]